MLLFATSVALAVTVDQVPNPRDHGGWVTDLADVLPPEAEARLDSIADGLHRDLDAEVAIVTVPSASDAPKTFATTLFNRWGIGDEQANNGLLVLLVLDQRRLEMETGYGIEGVLPDGWLGAMQADKMVPAFKLGDYGAGVEAGLVAIDERMRQNPEDVRLGTDGPIAVAGRAAATNTRLGLAAGAGGLGVLTSLGVGGMLVARRRQRTCDKCHVYMPLLDEDQEDAHLDPGQRSEERLGSVEWYVHQCPQCQAIRTFSKVRWFSGYSSCRHCGHRTRETSTFTEVHATQFSGGRVRIVERCRHCSKEASYTRHTPPLPTVSSHSSSDGGGGGGGGSFGGGSSGGGGAGSSW